MAAIKLMILGKHIKLYLDLDYSFKHKLKSPRDSWSVAMWHL